MQLKNKKSILALNSLIFLVCTFMVYLFSIPQVDDFRFIRNSSSELSSIVSQSFYYGNGRFLGNLFGYSTANNFTVFSCIIAPIVIFLIVFLINRILFKNNSLTIIPIAILFMLMPYEEMKEAYFWIPSVCNYVFPLLFALISYSVVSSFKKDMPVYKKALLSILLIVSSVASCLFSENTTLVIVVASIILLIANVKKNLLGSVINLASVLIGTIAMILIPYVSKTNGSLDNYRHVSTNVGEILSKSMLTASNFGEIFSRYLLVIIVISVSLILLSKKENAKSTFLGIVQKSILVLYPLLCGVKYIFFREIINTRLTYLFFVFLAAYVLDIIYTVITIKDKKIRNTSLSLILLIAISFAPNLIVSPNGPRTYYLVFFLCLIFALYLFGCSYKKNLFKINTPKVKTLTSVVSVVVLLSVSLSLFMQSMINFSCFAVRSEYVISNVSSESKINIPKLPYDDIAYESDSRFAVSFAYNMSRDFEIAPLEYCEIQDEYNQMMYSSYLKTFKYALNNFDYKNPRYLQEKYDKAYSDSKAD